MKPERIGRVMGIGLRVAGRIVGQRVAGEPRAASAVRDSRATGQAMGRATAEAGRSAARAGKNTAAGVGGFLRPFRRVGGILWLEVTGTFFLLFALVFAWYAWQSWRTHTMRSVELSVGVMLVFLYLGVSAFWRAGRR